MGNYVTPSTLKAAEGMAKYSDAALLSVFICLPVSAEEPQVAGEVIGWMSLGAIPQSVAHHRRSTFGIGFAKQHQGKGYGTEALTWMISWAFRVYGLNKVEGGVFAWNQAARALYKKVGFTEEGIQKKHMWQEGAFQDNVCLGLLAEEWWKLRGDKRQS